MAEYKGISVKTQGLECPDCGETIVVPSVRFWSPLLQLWHGDDLEADETQPGPISMIMENHYKQCHSLL